MNLLDYILNFISLLLHCCQLSHFLNFDSTNLSRVINHLKDSVETSLKFLQIQLKQSRKILQHFSMSRLEGLHHFSMLQSEAQPSNLKFFCFDNLRNFDFRSLANLKLLAVPAQLVRLNHTKSLGISFNVDRRLVVFVFLGASSLGHFQNRKLQIILVRHPICESQISNLGLMISLSSKMKRS